MNDTITNLLVKVLRYLAMVITGLVLASCSDESSNEALSFP